METKFEEHIVTLNEIHTEMSKLKKRMTELEHEKNKLISEVQLLTKNVENIKINQSESSTVKTNKTKIPSLEITSDSD